MAIFDPNRFKVRGKKRKRAQVDEETDDPDDPRLSRTTLFVTSIPYSAKDEDLLKIFSSYGPVKSCFVVRDEDGGKNKGYGFVCYSFRDDAIKALNELNGKPLMGGRALRIKHAFKKNTRDLIEKRAEKNTDKIDNVDVGAEDESIKIQDQTTSTLFIRGLKVDDGISLMDYVCDKFSEFGELLEVKLDASSTCPGTVKVLLKITDQEKFLRSDLFNNVISGKKLTKLLNEFEPKKFQNGTEEEDGSKMFLENLPFSCKIKDIYNIIDKSFEITYIKLPRDNSEKIKGYAFAKFKTPTQAKEFFEKYSDKNGSRLKLFGRTLRMSIVGITPKPQKKEKKSTKDASSSCDPDEDISNKITRTTTTGYEKLIQPEHDNIEKKNQFYEGCTLFIRNLPPDITDETLKSSFKKWGNIRIAKVTVNKMLNKPTNSGFICYYEAANAKKCLEDFKEHVNTLSTIGIDVLGPSTIPPELPSVISEKSKNFMINSYPIQVLLALSKDKVQELNKKDDNSKRNLYLLMEGTVFPDSPSAKFFDKKELDVRLQSYKNRKQQLAKNPYNAISKTRICVRNIRKNVNNAILKNVAIKCVQLFWKGVLDNKRPRLEEAVLSGYTLKRVMNVDRVPPIVQVKIVSQKDNKKVSANESKNAPNTTKTNNHISKGYGFIEFKYHYDALAFLRYANNNPFAISTDKAPSSIPDNAKISDILPLRKPIVEFAIENTKILAQRAMRANTEAARKHK